MTSGAGDGGGITLLGYRPPLDGIRAVAIALVMMYHADKSAVPNGRLGVDLFFVLSGFLITTLLLEEHAKTHTIAFARFYVRRALRLFPALYTMLAVVVVVGLLLSSGSRLREGLIEVASSALYVRNWAGAFGVKEVWVPHTWSLSLEEQFYLLWPPILFFLFLRRGRSASIPFVLGGLVSLSLAARLVEGRTIVPEALLVGCLAAGVLFHAAPSSRTATSFDLLRVAAVVGAALGMAAVFTPTPNPATMETILGRGGSVALAACAGFVVVDLVRAPGSWVATLLALRPVTYIGRISYGLYIWHIPVYKAFGAVQPSLPGPAVVAAKMGLSIVVAVVSYHLIEQPALRLKRRFYPAAQPPDGPGPAAAIPLALRSSTMPPGIRESPPVSAE